MQMCVCTTQMHTLVFTLLNLMEWEAAMIRDGVDSIKWYVVVSEVGSDAVTPTVVKLLMMLDEVSMARS